MAAQPVILTQLHRWWESALSLLPSFRCKLLVDSEAREAILDVVYNVRPNRQLLWLPGLMLSAMSETSWHDEGGEDHQEYDYLSAGLHQQGLQQPLVRTLIKETPSAKRDVTNLEVQV